ncbi:hypothetical protein CP98_01297 [Sphingobium yanoikuyae]|uniref:Bacteriophage tail tape measure N-terminal domain-containing protein n=1 Tax=Sphingobium yanoikuyae TaxID=13690 RepID=A0A084EQ50_SPHYA|nr:hypothetical protein [Sphingobium yanoikuyae]KEZ20092.1 hypothetical protein CP98_01297 [Sphingobium yanoikuyae]
MSVPKVAIRLGTEGKNEVTRDFREVGEAGDAAAARASKAFDKAAGDFESAERRMAAAAQKIAAIMPQTAMQMQVNDSVGTGSTLNEGSARFSAAAFRELYAEQERLTAGAAALRAQLDPTWAAQQRFNTAMGEARTLIAAGSITLDEYCAKLRIEEAALAEVSSAQVRTHATSGAMRAGMQQLGFQAQDFTVQVLGGTDAVRAFAMQAPQAIGALQMMAGSTEGGAGKFAKFASLLSGPVGIAIGVAIPLAILLGEKIFDMGDDADNAANKVDRLGDALKRLRQEQASQADIGEVLTKVNALRDQRMNLTVPRARGESPESYSRRLAEARGKLDTQIADFEQQIAWNEVAQQAKRDAAAYKATRPAAVSRGGGRSRSGSTSISDGDRRAQALLAQRNGWLNDQVGGAGARESLAAEGDKLADQQKLLRSMNDDISAGTALLNIEWEMRGKSRQEIEAAVELKRFEIDLQRQGIDLDSEEARDAIGRKAAQISFNQVLEESVDKMETLRDIGADAIGTILNPDGWTNWKSMALGAINDVTQAFWKLAVINPIQNKLGGSTLPTIGNLLGLGKASGGVKGESLLGSAIGNNYTPAGAMLVGENGPEVVNMPRGAQVMTASESRRMMAGNDSALQVQVVKGDLFDVIVAQISAGVSADTVATAAPVIAIGASNGAQQAVEKRNGRRLA